MDPLDLLQQTSSVRDPCSCNHLTNDTLSYIFLGCCLWFSFCPCYYLFHFVFSHLPFVSTCCARHDCAQFKSKTKLCGRAAFVLRRKQTNLVRVREIETINGFWILSIGPELERMTICGICSLIFTSTTY